MNDKKHLSVADVMSKEYLLLPGMSTVAEALERMADRDMNAVLVDKRSDDDEYGIVLTSDIAKRVLAPDRSPERVNLYEIMSKPVLSVAGRCGSATARGCSNSSGLRRRRSSTTAGSTASSRTTCSC